MLLSDLHRIRLTRDSITVDGDGDAGTRLGHGKTEARASCLASSPLPSRHARRCASPHNFRAEQLQLLKEDKRQHSVWAHPAVVRCGPLVQSGRALRGDYFDQAFQGAAVQGGHTLLRLNKQSS